MKLRWGRRLRGIAIFALLFAAARSYGQAQAEGLVQTPALGAPVVAVRIVSEDGRVLSESPSGLAIEIGKPLNREQVARSLRALYGLGDYSDLKAVVTPVGDGVRLDFVVRESLFFNEVRIEGLTPPPTDSSAAAAMQLTLGRPFRQEDVDEGLAHLRDVLKDEGLYTAEVSAENKPHLETHQMDILVHVKSGPRARVEAVELKNGTAYRDAEILSRLKMKAGQVVT